MGRMILERGVAIVYGWICSEATKPKLTIDIRQCFIMLKNDNRLTR